MNIDNLGLGDISPEKKERIAKAMEATILACHEMIFGLIETASALKRAVPQEVALRPSDVAAGKVSPAFCGNCKHEFPTDALYCPNCGQRAKWPKAVSGISTVAKGESERKCRVCGCTDDYGCPEGCWWVEPNLCSRCAVEVDNDENEG